MLNTNLSLVLLLACSGAFAQSAATPAAVSLPAPTTLPIVFTKSVSAGKAHPGDTVLAKTMQAVPLPNGAVIPKGSRIIGHVLASSPFAYDTTPYAHQKPSTLSLHFDSVLIGKTTVPLDVTVRALADPITTQEARTPVNHDIDASGMTTQIGGDQRYPWSAPVVNRDGDVVAYTRHGGVFAHLVANNGCDGSDVEVSMGIYSASACGLYGFTTISAQERGSAANPSTLTLVSTHTSPTLWKGGTALLEVLPRQSSVASR